jgi:hypothetical protein
MGGKGRGKEKERREGRKEGTSRKENYLGNAKIMKGGWKVRKRVGGNGKENYLGKA